MNIVWPSAESTSDRFHGSVLYNILNK